MRTAPQPRTLATMTRRAHVTRWFAAGMVASVATTPMVAHADGAPVVPKSVPTSTKPGAQGTPTQEAAPATASDVPPSPHTGVDPSSSESAERDEPNITAKEAFEQAVDAYRAGDKVTALNDMEQSYALSNQPELLYNIAKIERELDQCASALANYQRYLHDDPTGTQRDAAIDGVRVLSAECLRPAPPTAPVALLTTTAPPTYWTTPHVVGWTAIGAGAAAAAASLGFGLAANGSMSQANDEIRSDQRGGHAYRDASYQDAERHRATSTAFGVAAGAFIAGGVFCLTLWHPRRERPATTVSFVAAPGGASLAYSRGF